MKILYIAGTKHSGSTVLGMMLGEHQQLVNAGEVVVLPKVLLRNPESTNRTIEDIPYWEAVVDSIPPRQVQTISRHYTNTFGERNLLPLLASSRYRQAYADTMRVFLSSLKQAHANMAASFLIDSSKSMARAIGLSAFRQDGQPATYVIHIERRLSGFVESKIKRGIALHLKSVSNLARLPSEYADRRAHFPAWKIGLYTLTWVFKNGVGRLILPLFYGKRLLRLKYEDLLNNPQAELAKIGEHIGIEFDRDYLIRVSEQPIQQTPVISGNFLTHLKSFTLNPTRSNPQLNRRETAIVMACGGFLNSLFR